jgi:hypothetical protein
MAPSQASRRWSMVWPFLLTAVGCLFVAHLRGVVFHLHGDALMFVAGIASLLIGGALGVRRWSDETVRRVRRFLAIGVPLILAVRVTSWFL